MAIHSQILGAQPRIYKYNLGYVNRGILTTTISGPRLRNVLDIQEQANNLVVWAVVDTAHKNYEHTIEVYSAYTGDPPPGEGWNYVKTIQSEFDGLVYHLYIKHNW